MNTPERIYFSVDPEVTGGESPENLKKVMEFLQSRGYTVYRAPYVFADDRDEFLQRELGLDRPATLPQQRDLHMKWIDQTDILLADISTSSEGRAMIIQRALDKPTMGLPQTHIIFIKGKSFDRHIGKIVRGLIEGDEVVYFEYDRIEEVIENWDTLVAKKK
ncbi:hypothetical protein HY086_00905 [Candidatus Gottesmanbacteria bacterium]|nr:hypothetical protein [Candidatus Gottesmanbacteria bacterium]